MHNEIDLDRYFARIGYQGPRLSTLDVLSSIQRLHVHAIPFENLDVLAGRRISLEPAAVVEKLVERRRGGYCFETNQLLAQALKQLNFRVTPLIARVLWGSQSDEATPETHMILRVDLDDGPWIVDAGFGSVTLTSPLRLIVGQTQQTTLEPFRLVDALPSGSFDLELQSGERWAKVYRFNLHPVAWIDYEVSNWFTSTHPASFFPTDLIVTHAGPDGRASLFNDRLNERTKDGRVTKRSIADASELATLLRDYFGIDLGDLDIESIFERVKGRTLTQMDR